MAKTTLNKLPKNVLNKVEEFKTRYTNLSATGSLREMKMKDEIRIRMASYVEGLRDAGLITERERQIIFVYMTV